MQFQIDYDPNENPVKRAAKVALAAFVILGALAFMFFVVLPAVFVVVGMVLIGLAIAVPIAIVVRAVWYRDRGGHDPR